MTTRRIAHVDMDAFYVSVEVRDNPTLRGLPVVVGGPAEGRGVVSAASYEVRRYGVHSAMPMAEAVRRCPQLVRLPVRMDRYVDASRRVMEVLERFSPRVEPLSLDEAFLDLTGAERSLGPSPALGLRIKREIHEETGGLTASVGIAPVKFVAKIASDLEKPDGLVIVEPGGVEAFLHPLPMERLWGVGPRTRARLTELGFARIGDLARAERRLLDGHFGRSGTRLQDLARGIDERGVQPHHDAKSYSHEVTFARDQTDRKVLTAVLLDQAVRVSRRLRRDGMGGRTVVLKLRDRAFHTITRNRTQPSATDDADHMYGVACRLLDESWDGRPVRLIGVGVHGIVSLERETLSLFEADPADEKRKRLTETLDELGERFGRGKIFRAGTMRRDEAGDTGSSLQKDS